MTVTRLYRSALVLGALVAAGVLAGTALSAAGAKPAVVKVLPGSWPLSIRSGAGSIWVSTHRSYNLYRIDPRTNKIVATIDIGREMCGRIEVGFGEAWVPRCDEPNGIVVVDAAKNRVRKVVPAFGLDVAFANGSVWVPSVSGDLDRVDPVSLKTTASIPKAGGYVAFDGTSVWSLGDGGILRQIDPQTNAVVWTTTVPDTVLDSYLDAYLGYLWLAGGESAHIARLDLKTKTFQQLAIKAQPNLGDRPLAVGRGSVWWRTSNAKVSRIDARSAKVTATYPAPSFGWQEVAFNSLWTTNVVPSNVWRQRIVK